MAERDAAEAHHYRRILVCFDGSENAVRALRRAVAVAKEKPGKLSIIVAADTSSYNSRYLTRYHKELHDDLLDYARDQLSRAVEIAKRSGISEVEGYVAEGHPAETILARATDVDADLIVVGRRGLRSVERFLLGSVSSSIVSQSVRDVLVVK